LGEVDRFIVPIEGLSLSLDKGKGGGRLLTLLILF
jgi:hypothetical protein